MKSSFDLKKLDSLLKDFYRAVGIRISIFDDSFNLVTEYPKNAPLFCLNIRNKVQGAYACKACDKAACMNANKARKAIIYECHAGLTEAITPIQVEDQIIGYAILAHMLPKEEIENSIKNTVEKCKPYGIFEEEILTSLDGVAIKNKEEIKASVSLLDAVASYIYTKDMAIFKDEDLFTRIKQYIDENLSSNLSSETLCAKFHCSRTYLYKESKKRLDLSLNEYITEKRMKQAKKLLLSGYSIKDITDLCGYSDYNYFCKVFKKNTGTSPSRYRSKKIDE